MQSLEEHLYPALLPLHSPEDIPHSLRKSKGLVGTPDCQKPTVRPSGVTTVMENVRLGLLPAALQEDVGGGALSGGEGADTPTKVSAAHFF